MRIPSWWSFVLLLLCVPAFADPARLVKDINPGLEPLPEDPSEGSSFFSSYTPVNGRVVFLTFFQDEDSLTGDFQCGLWVTDGTAGGTERLAELCADAEEPFDRHVSILATTGSVAFLTDFSGQLWRTDGTAAGTFKLSNATVQFAGGSLKPALLAGRTLFFSGCSPAKGCEPWVSDGTREGTRLVRDIAPGRRSSFPQQFVLAPGRGVVFLTGGTGALWVSDGTEAGTAELFRSKGSLGNVVVKGGLVYLTAFVDLHAQVWAVDLNTGKRTLLKSFNVAPPDQAVHLEEAGGRLLITYYLDDSGKASLWETDGTRAGTRQLGPPFQLEIAAGQFMTVGGRAVIPARRVGSPQSPLLDLWILDPAARRPRQLQGCPEGCPRVAIFGLEPYGLVFKGRLFFAGWDAAHGYELWETDGTPQGTRLVKDLCPGTCDGRPLGFRTVLGRLLFEDAGHDLWASDGTTAGTVRVAGTPYRTSPVDVAPLAGRVVFTGLDPVFGPQPLVSDLTPGSAELILPLGGGIAASSRIQGLTALGGKSVFTACVGTAAGVWASDGTEAGTIELPVGEAACDPYPFTFFRIAGNLAFFSWKGKLWRTDGTSAGTVELLDLAPYFPVLYDAAALGGKLFFFLLPSQPVPGQPVNEFWMSDGTPRGTVKVFQKLWYTGASFPLTSVGTEAYFSRQEVDPPGGPTFLYRTDGTEAGTRPILKIAPDSTNVFEHARLDGKTYFITRSPDRQLISELWVTDGTAAGTAPVIPSLTAPRPVDPVELTVFKGVLYFFTNHGTPNAPVGLWRSDGTAAGTRLVRAIEPPANPDGDPANYPFLLTELTPAGDDLFFRADDGVHGVELWRSDGTAEGTVLVEDIAPGAATARVSNLTAAGGRLYFAATDVEHGLELWVSDGTAAGTRLVDDVQPGPDSSAPSQLTAADGKLFFTANDGVHGRELWVLPVP